MSVNTAEILYFEQKLTEGDGVPKGDTLEFKPDGDRFYIDPKFVISRNTNGGTASVFANTDWDFKAYTNCVTPYLNFTLALSDKSKISSHPIVHELKEHMFALLYLNDKKSSVGTLYGQLIILKRYARMAFDMKVSLKQFIAGEGIKRLFSALTNYDKENAKIHLRLLKTLSVISTRYPGLVLHLNEENETALNRLIECLPEKKAKQTAIIPCRIYSNLLKFIEDFHREWSAIIRDLESLYIQRSKKPYYGLKPNEIKGSPEEKKVQEKYKQTAEFYDEHYPSLAEAIKKYALTKKPDGVSEVYDSQMMNSCLSNVQIILSWYVHAFSGMRKHEMRALPYFCTEKIKGKSTNFNVLNSYTEKLEVNGPNFASWVIPANVLPVIETLQKIVNIQFLSEKRESPETIQKAETNADVPLFINVKLDTEMSETGSRYTHIRTESLRAYLARNWIAKYYPHHNLSIIQGDIDELYQFDLLGEWEERKGFEVGSMFPFASHQFRRSLVVYAMRSNTVTLRALKKQLKHLNIVMTSYYANNSSMAKAIVSRDRGDSQRLLVEDLNREQAIGQAERFLSDVVDAKYPLQGAGGARFEGMRKRGELPTLEEDRVKTVKRFETGQQWFGETPWGGCANLDFCEKIAFTDPTSCLECSDAAQNSDEKQIHLMDLTESVLAEDEAEYQGSPFATQLAKQRAVVVKRKTSIQDAMSEENKLC